MYFILFILLTVPLLAQEVSTPATPTPTPEATATPAVEPTPAATTDSVPSPTATPEKASAEPATPSEKKTETEDVIPLPPESGGAETPMVSETDVAPVAKPGTDQALPDSAFADPNSVIPDGSPAIPPAPAGPSATEIERKLKVRYKEVRTEVEKDPAVRSLWEQARSAKSFEDERAALREYYRLLFKKMKKVDKDLTARCEVMENAYIARLAQSRVEPTIPLNPPPTPEPLAN
ncbi:MAG: hypothetical protein D4R65_05335 [Verrucomicrobiaceae bacterium]|nr:MAG: hypothetical protein D4R65_05335 [Verrucomicrobiaceae bacterium]